MKTRDVHHKNDSMIKKVFSGSVSETDFIPYPTMTSEDKGYVSDLLARFNKFADEHIDSKKIEKDELVPMEVINGLAELGVFGTIIPKEYGGGGSSMSAYCRITEGLAARDAAVTITVGAHQSIGMKAIMLFGSDEQKKKYLPDLATGKKIAAYALTEPAAGSDARSLQGTAKLDDSGEYYIINANKMYITNGSIADVFTVFAQVEVEKDGKKVLTPAAFIVTKDMGGITVTPNMHKMGIKGSMTNVVILKDVKVPVSNRIGNPEDGFKIALEVLNEGRLSLGAGAVGGCKNLLDLATKRVNTRKAFGHRIGDFEMIKRKLFEMAVYTYAVESMVYLTAGLVDKGQQDFAIEAAICKVYGTEALWEVSNHCLQIYGGDGFLEAYPVERVVRDARINMIFEGTNEILRSLIALMGAREAGESLKASSHSLTGMLKLGVGQIIGSKMQFNNLSPTLQHYGEILAERIKSFKMMSDRVVIKYGKDIVNHEHMQERLSTALIHIYAMMATLSRVNSRVQGAGGADISLEIKLLDGVFAFSSPKVIDSLHTIEENHDAIVNAIANDLETLNGYNITATI